MVNNNITKKNTAFTLAEILIVLSTIGILTVLAINSMKNTVDKSKTMYKKAYSNLEQVVGELVNDEQLYPYDVDYMGFKNIVQKEIPGKDGEKTPATTGATSTEAKQKIVTQKFAALVQNELEGIPLTESQKSTYCQSITYKADNATATKTATPEACFQSADGIVWFIIQDGWNMIVVVDTDGLDKGPNDIVDTGKGSRDRFNMHVRYDGKMLLKSNGSEDKEIEFLRSHSFSGAEKK